MKKIQLCIIVLLLFIAGTAFASDGGCVAQFLGGEEYGGEYMVFIPSIKLGGDTRLFAYLQYEPYVDPVAFFLYDSWDSSLGFSELDDCGSASATFEPYIRPEGITVKLHVPQLNVYGTIIWADFAWEEVSSEPGHSGIYFSLVDAGLAE